MAHLTFVYGTVNSGKSMELLRINHNYESLGRKVALLTPTTDTRSETPEVWSRAGMSAPAMSFTPDDDLLIAVDKSVEAVLVDEAQFLTRDQVDQLAYMADYLDVSVMAFGLKNDSNNNLFEGSEALVVTADKLEEIKTINTYGQGKATMNLKLVDGKPSFNNPQVEIEAKGKTTYIPVSRKSYTDLLRANLGEKRS